jgi:hypothetical protein
MIGTAVDSRIDASTQKVIFKFIAGLLELLKRTTLICAEVEATSGAGITYIDIMGRCDNK